MSEMLSPAEIDRRYGTDPAITAQADTAAVQRDFYMQQVSRLSPHLPQLPDDAANTIYEQIEANERELAPLLHLSEYDNGRATHDDEVVYRNRGRGALLSADHATNPVRKMTGVREGADHGTGGLAMTLSDNEGWSYVLPAGRQKGNANVDMSHPIKDAIDAMLPGHGAFLSVHGMLPGKFVHQFDDCEIHGVIGLGTEPTEFARDTAQDMLAKARDKYGLRLIVGNDTAYFNNSDHSPRLEYDSEGLPKQGARLAASGAGSTTNYVRREAEDTLFPALQIELSRTLRLLPKEMEYRDIRHKVMSVYMGYLLTRDIVMLALER